MQNPFWRELRSSFESLYKQTAERNKATTVIVPSVDCLEVESFNQAFVETHLLQASHVPGCHMNLVGQGVEITDSNVSTHLCFQEARTCEILQTESMYEYSNSVRIIVTDKPLIGKYKIMPGAADRSASKAGAQLGSPLDEQVAKTLWLETVPSIQNSFMDQVERFRNTFVQVPGCEQSTAERIREITDEATERLMKHHKVSQASLQKQIESQVSRNAYVCLHSFLFPHLQRILASAEDGLDKAIKIYPSPKDLVDVIPGAGNRGLDLVDFKECSKHLSQMDHSITPHEKIGCIESAYLVLKQCVGEDGERPWSPKEGSMEITGDDVLSLFILSVHGSELKSRLAHVAHVEMYLQGATRSEAARFEEAGYAVAAFQAALQFFLDEKKRTSVGRSTSAPRSSAKVFANYAQGSGLNTGSELDTDYDLGTAQLPGKARPVRGQDYRFS